MSADSRPPDGRSEAVVERLRKRFGPEVDPEITLSDESTLGPQPGAGHDDSGSGVLSRLGSRGGMAERYRLEGEIARGGMGAILEVWDEDLRRRSAMKVALSRTADGESAAAKVDELDPRVLARFLEEAQVTGQLEHPGIVPVHELGLDENGQVFFTMRLVRGRDLDAVFQLVGDGAEGWSVTRALGVLLKVCEAMAYAHDKGVVHRDLKPANVMVGRFGEVYVMDWGLARVQGHEDRHDLRLKKPGETVKLVATDRKEGVSSKGGGDALHTMDGDVIGTPAFMAPEQARGELAAIDARTDVYSLGAMMYRLLGRTTPYVPRGEYGNTSKILTALLDGPPRPLEELAADVPAELIAICEKAMARKPGERYPDMLALAEDLRAFLENRVVRAYETGALAEARKWVRRNKPLAVSLAAGVLALIGGLAASLFLKQRADENAVLAEDRRVQAEEAADLAEERRVAADASALAALREARINKEVNSFLNDDLFAAVSPEHQGIDVTVREVLDIASLRLTGRFVDEPLIEAELRWTLGTSFQRLGEYERAHGQLARSYELRLAELGPDAEKTLISMRSVASVLAELGRHAEALELSERALELARRILGPEHEGSLSTWSDLALVHSDMGRDDESLLIFEQILAIQQRNLGPEHLDTLTTMNNLAVAYEETGRLQESVDMAEGVLANYRRLLGDRHPETLNSLSNLAIVYIELGRFADSEALHEESVATSRAILGEDHPRTARSLGNLGVLYTEMGRWKEAEKILTEGVEILRRTIGEDHPDTLQALGNLAVSKSSQGRYAEALELRLETFEKQKQSLGLDHPQTMNMLSNLGVIYRDLGRYEEAEASYQQALDLRRKVLGQDHPDTLITLENLGGVYYTIGDYERSLEITLEVLEARERTLGPDHIKVARTMYNVAMVLQSMGEIEEAVTLFEDALVRNRKTLGAHPQTAECVTQLAKHRMNAGEYEAAAESYGEAIDMYRELGTENGDVAFWLHQRGFALYELGAYEESAAVLEEALPLRRRFHGEDGVESLNTLYLLVRTLVALERFARAEELGIEYVDRNEALYGTQSRDTVRGRRLLVRLYETWGKPDDAELWR